MIQPRLAHPCTARTRHSHASAVVRVPYVAVRAASAEVADDMSTKEVTKLLDTLTQPEMTIAELHLEMGDFEIKVRRKLDATPAAAAPAAAPAASGMASVATVIAPDNQMQPSRLAPLPYMRCEEYYKTTTRSCSWQACLGLGCSLHSVYAPAIWARPLPEHS